MARPFNFSEFETFTATLSRKNQTIGLDGGLSNSPTLVATIIGSFHRGGGSKKGIEGREGAREIDELASFVTSAVSTDVRNGDILAIGSEIFEVDHWDRNQSFIGNYLDVALKAYVG